MTKSIRLPLISLLLLGTLLLATLLWWQPQQAPTSAAPALPPGGDFTLHSAAGPVSLQALRGKVVLLYFGYTSCPDICPTSLTMMKIALSQLSSEELEQVAGIFVSVDPERDTPQRLAQYTHHFHPSITGVTGSRDEVAEVAQHYGAIYRRAEGETALGYTVDHSSITYVIDQQGRLVKTLPHGALPQTILQELRRLLEKR